MPALYCDGADLRERGPHEREGARGAAFHDRRSRGTAPGRPPRRSPARFARSRLRPRPARRRRARVRAARPLRPAADRRAPRPGSRLRKHGRRADRGEAGGRGMATAAIVLGIIGCVCGVLALVVAVVQFSGPRGF
ncbi:hypothetical protein SSBG_02701 [Streptomyces sp. SPB074]|nr:hypothetical protein SSBG_02701 [Streptomyces sp. SPB074]